MILALSVVWHCPARHGDIPAAYTKAAIEADADIYMYPPNGMTLTPEERATGGQNTVLKLQRSLYGLKQAGRLWNNMLHSQLISIGYTRCMTDLCLYYKRDDKHTAIVGIYVDDLLATATSPRLVDDLFDSLKTLEVKDLGTVRKFLGMRVAFKPDGFTLDQEMLVREYIEAHSLTHATPLATPAMLHQDPGGDEPLSAEDTKQFRTLAGGLLWLARCTRPDIAFAVHQLTRHTHAPRVSDMRLGKRVLRYLLGTSTMKLHVQYDGRNALALSGYTDADFAARDSDRKSISAAAIYVNGMLIHWYCTKQTNVALSTMESEFVAAARGVQELLGCQELLGEIGATPMQPIPVYMDNQAAIAQIISEASSQRSKHIDIKYKFLKDLYYKEQIKPIHVPTKSMIADLMTKAFPTPDFRRLCALIGLVDPKYQNGDDTRRGGVLEAQ
jgi:hypothetical protein